MALLWVELPCPIKKGVGHFVGCGHIRILGCTGSQQYQLNFAALKHGYCGFFVRVALV